MERKIAKKGGFVVEPIKPITDQEINDQIKLLIPSSLHVLKTIINDKAVLPAVKIQAIRLLFDNLHIEEKDTESFTDKIEKIFAEVKENKDEESDSL